jgi:hypothetical protein
MILGSSVRGAVHEMREAPWGAAAFCRFPSGQLAGRETTPGSDGGEQARGIKAAASCRTPRRLAHPFAYFHRNRRLPKRFQQMLKAPTASEIRVRRRAQDANVYQTSNTMSTWLCSGYWCHFLMWNPFRGAVFPRRRESTPQIPGNRMLRTWIPAFARMTAFAKARPSFPSQLPVHRLATEGLRILPIKLPLAGRQAMICCVAVSHLLNVVDPLAEGQ